jgi:hypothetical protein
MSLERTAEVRQALSAIAADPDYGAAVLSSTRTLTNLLNDLLPDAPREKSELVGAAEARLGEILLDRVSHGMDPTDMVRQEIYGYLLTHYAISALICKAATEAGVDPDRVKFKRTVRIVRRRAADPAAFPP